MKKIYFLFLGIFFTMFASAQTTATIAQIQGSTATSPYVGTSVITSGVVTAIVISNTGTQSGYYIQDGEGAWNGIYVFDNTNTPTVGDNITVTSDTVKEYFDMTELTYISSFVINSSNNPLPNPVVLSPAAASVEDYEGVLVTVNNVLCTGSPDQYGVWTGTSNGETLLVDDQMLKTSVFTPVVSVTYNVTGIINYDWSQFKIEPRTINDVTTAGVNELNHNGTSVYPIPATDNVNISSDKGIYSIEVYNVIGEAIFSKQYQGNKNLTVDVSGFETGMYIFKVDYRKSSAVYRIIVK